MSYKLQSFISYMLTRGNIPHTRRGEADGRILAEAGAYGTVATDVRIPLVDGLVAGWPIAARGAFTQSDLLEFPEEGQRLEVMRVRDAQARNAAFRNCFVNLQLGRQQILMFIPTDRLLVASIDEVFFLELKVDWINFGAGRFST